MNTEEKTVAASYLVIVEPKSCYETSQRELLLSHAETPSDEKRLKDWLFGGDDYPYVKLLHTKITVIRLANLPATDRLEETQE